MARTKSVVLLFGALIALAGCQRPGQKVYTPNEVGRANFVNFGTVVAVREVQVQGQAGPIGTGIGAAGGGIAGSQFGRSGGSLAATLAGVVIGGVVGAATESAVGSRSALEYTLTMESGSTLTVVQDRNEGERVLQPGERIMLQGGGGTQRVLPAGGPRSG